MTHMITWLFILLAIISQLQHVPLVVGAQAHRSRDVLEIAPCVHLSTSYHPSALEKEWAENVALWANSGVNESTFCSTLIEDIEEIDSISALVGKLMDPSSIQGQLSSPPSPGPRLLFSTAAGPGSRLLLSHFRYKFDCGGMSERYFHSPIQPLIGSLRHPYYPCKERERALGDRGYMLLANSLDPLHRFEFQKAIERPRVLVFDLGASTYDQGLGGASQQWFMDKLESRGFVIDAYYAWEAALMEAREVFDPVPGDLLPRYHYYNVPAVSDPNDPANPLNMIKRSSVVGDYVVLKLDIDNSEVEMEFVDQIMEDPVLQSLIDEFFFEHHVNFQPLNEFWGTQEETMQLGDSYEIFRRLRDLGIRAHGWN